MQIDEDALGEYCEGEAPVRVVARVVPVARILEDRAVAPGEPGLGAWDPGFSPILHHNPQAEFPAETGNWRASRRHLPARLLNSPTAATKVEGANHAKFSVPMMSSKRNIFYK